MDIFTTQLTKVRQTPIKPASLKIKALKKEGKTKALNEQEDHLSGDVELHEEINAEVAQDQMTKQDDEPEHEIVEPLLYDDIHKENTHHKEVQVKDESDEEDTPPHIDVFI